MVNLRRRKSRRLLSLTSALSGTLIVSDYASHRWRLIQDWHGADDLEIFHGLENLSTVKPLYSEQSRDPKKCSLYRGVHPRGMRYVHVHICLQYIVHRLKWFRPCYFKRDSSGGRAIFHDSFSFFLYVMIYLVFYTGIAYSTCISHRRLVYHSSSIHSPILDVHTMPAICKLIGIWPFHFKHCSHDWDTNKTISTWYSVHGNLKSLATMDLGQPGRV